MREKTIIEKVVRERTELQQNNAVDFLLEQFPPELQSRINEEIADLDDTSAIDYLTTKLVNRRFALISKTATDLPEGISIGTEIPLAITKFISESEKVEGSLLGQGYNGRVLRSVRQPTTCYKILYLERAKLLFATAARETFLQYRAGEILKGKTNVAQVPKALRYIDHQEVRAIQMEVIDGVSIKDISKGKAKLPLNFNLKNFILKLSNAVKELNLHGIFHRDLLKNLGNVIVDKDGNPWIIDFGAAFKANFYSEEGSSYKIAPNGASMLSTDLAGVHYIESELTKIINQPER